MTQLANMISVLLSIAAACVGATDPTVLSHLTTVKQISPWQHFSLGVQETPYVLVELWIHVLSSPLALMASSELLPNTSIAGFPADVLDESGWSFNKTYHHLRLSGERNWTIAVYSTAQSVSYNIQVSPSVEPTCPRNCSENGVCVQGVCHCSEHFIDADCSLFTSHLMLDNHIVIPTPVKTWCFLSISDADQDLDLFVSVAPSTAIAQVYLRCADPFPTPQLPPTPYRNIDSIRFFEANDSEQLFAVPCTTGLISMYNEDEKTITLTYEIHKIAKKQQNNVLYIIVAVVVAITLSWACAYAASTSVYRRAVSLAQTDVGTGLATEIIDTMFPTVMFAGEGKDMECAICLETLVQGIEVRVLPCTHIFHARCLDPWFALHTVNHIQFCCTCKFDCSIQQSVLEESDTNAIEEAQ